MIHWQPGTRAVVFVDGLPSDTFTPAAFFALSAAQMPTITTTTGLVSRVARAWKKILGIKEC